LRPGTGKIEVNGRPLAEYFPNQAARLVVQQPLLATETSGKFDVLVLAHGGGPVGQAGAIRLGLARALQIFNAELRGALKKLGYLTRDPRKHERKKYGRPGARKRFQYSKR
jgi:small subunit ribosomal protein S9